MAAADDSFRGYQLLPEKCKELHHREGRVSEIIFHVCPTCPVALHSLLLYIFSQGKLSWPVADSIQIIANSADLHLHRERYETNIVGMLVAWG